MWINNEASLQQTSLGLEGLPFKVFKGNVGDPVDMLDAFRREGGVMLLFALVKLWGKSGVLNEGLELKVVTCGTQVVFDRQKVRPFGASVLGMVMALSREYRNACISCVDVGDDALGY